MERTIQDAIHSLKYRRLKVAALALAELLVRYLPEHPIPGNIFIPVPVPVPLHPRRLRSKGYNQSALLAKTLSKKLGLEINQRLMTRTRNTPPQVNASRVDRWGIIQGSFRCDGPVDNRAVILVDDVTTTGSTLSTCAAALKAAGAASVWGLILAREI